MLEHLKGKVRNQRPGRFVFEGPRPRGELGAAIRGAAVCCFPALWDNYPNALLEAMSLGACVVASDAGGMAEIVEDGESGVLFHGGNTTNLAATLRRVLGDAALRAHVSGNARARVMGLCEPGRVVAATVRAVEGARAGARFNPERGAGDVGSVEGRAGGLAVPVPFVSAGEERGGLLGRIRRLVGRRG